MLLPLPSISQVSGAREERFKLRSPCTDECMDVHMCKTRCACALLQPIADGRCQSRNVVQPSPKAVFVDPEKDAYHSSQVHFHENDEHNNLTPF